MRTPNVSALTAKEARESACPFNAPSGRHPRRTQLRSLAARSIVLFFCAILAIAAKPAVAAQITYVSVVGNWHDPTDNVPGVQPGDPVITNGVPTSIVRWGTTSGTPQSGYDYTATVPPPVTLPGPGPLFPLGTFSHLNYAISDPSLTSVKLDVVLVLNIDGVQTGPLTFTFTFNHEETPNNQNPCPYPTPPGEGCTDRVTIVSSPQPTTFNVGGVDYTLSMSFLDANGNPVSEFITREGGIVNTSGLVGQFTLPGVPPNTPVLTVKKTGPATMSPGVWGDFGVDVQNIGLADAFNATLIDRLPNGPTGGMCSNAPQVTSARVFASDGVTPVPGKGALVQGVDYALTYDGSACQLAFNAITAASVIGPGERLLIAYRTQLDAGAQNGASLTNVVGATQWYNGDSSDPARLSYTRTLTDGTPGVLDFQDAHTVTVALRHYYYEKTVADLTSGANPATTAATGDRLRYTLRVRSVDAQLDDVSFYDDMGAMNASPVFVPGSLTVVASTLPAGATNNSNPNVGTNNAGTLDIRHINVAPGGDVAIQFDITLASGLADGTQVKNQAQLLSNTATKLADSDDPNVNGVANPDVVGDEDPTVVFVGAQALTITKQVSVVGNGPALAGATLDYLVTVRNAGKVPAAGVYITDNLDENAPAYLLYVDQSAQLNGTANGISVAGAVITANYSAQYGPLAPGQSFQLRFQAKLNPNLAIGTRVTNTAHVTWNTDQNALASVSVDVGGMVGSGILNGAVWHDANFNDVLDTNERVLEGWTVELHRNGQIVATTTTDATGVYHIANVVPNYLTQDKYELIFRAPGAGARTALLGLASSQFSNALQRIYDIVVQSGSNLQNLNLPIDPDGVVYNSIGRVPLAGATLTLVDLNTDRALAASCFDDPNQQGQVTRTDGYYKFDINFSDPSCPNGGSYRIDVVPPSSGYETGYSRVIPPPDATKPPFDVPMCAGGADDAIPTTIDHCEMTTSEFAPPTSVAAQSRGTAYQVRLVLDGTRVPGSSQLFNNHIPVDPILSGVVAITKTTPMTNVTKGQMVPYTITVKNAWPFALTGVDVIDRYPVGFKYVEGSARFDDRPLEPKVSNGTLLWQNLTLAPNGEHTIKLLLAAGAGITEGKFTNYAFVQQNGTGFALSGQASATVQVVPDPTFDCTDVTGKVFDDKNRNGIQDPGEAGIPGARLITPTGLAALTDGYGRFHITCAITPHEGRGSNFMLKLDDRSLPSGYRSSTDQFQIQRATRGKALHFSFGASIHRVVGLDIADGVFAPDSTDMRPQWRPRVNLLLQELQKGPAILRLSYLADVEDPRLVEQRIGAMTKLVTDSWSEAHGGYPLVIEHEVFWRTGKPPSEDPRLKGLQQASGGKTSAVGASAAQASAAEASAPLASGGEAQR